MARAIRILNVEFSNFDISSLEWLSNSSLFTLRSSLFPYKGVSLFYLFTFLPLNVFSAKLNIFGEMGEQKWGRVKKMS